MTATDPERRRLLLGLLAAGTLPLLGACARRGGDALLLSSFRDAAGRHCLCALHSDGTLVWQRPVEARAHDVIADPAGERAVFFGRRPGRLAWVLSLRDGRLLRELRIPDRHHFNGHGAFAADGRTVFATETAYGPARGQIGVWDAWTGRRRGEFGSGGLDPHECLRLDDDDRLVVANGGLLTSPDDERAMLNVPTMAPRLSWLDAGSGRPPLRTETLPNRQLSIRHLDRLADGRVAVGLQYEGPKSDDVPLVVIAGAQSGLVPVATPAVGWRVYNQYVESVRVDAGNRYLVVTGPRGNTLGAWDLHDGRSLGQYTMADVSGLAPVGDGFVATSGLGAIARLDPGHRLRPVPTSGLRVAWDNHAQEVARRA